MLDTRYEDVNMIISGLYVYGILRFLVVPDFLFEEINLEYDRNVNANKTRCELYSIESIQLTVGFTI